MRKRLLNVVLVAVMFAAAAVPSFGWKFASTSDSQGFTNGVNVSVLTNIVNKINAEGVDLLIMQGDLVWGSSNDSTLASQYDQWLSVMSNLNCPYYVVPGNHDISTSTSENVWRSKFNMPMNGPSGYEETVWSFDHQNAHFVGLNSEHYGQVHLIQESWLASDLSATNQPHIFTMGHEPAYPKGPYPGQCLDFYPQERNDFWNILTKYGSKLFFCGHEHVYSHSLEGSVYQLINGPSGGDERPGYPGTIGVTNYVVITVDGSNVHGEGKNANGQVIHTWDYSVTPQTPYSGVIQLPGTIQAENFDNGGQGVAYYDTSGGNAGGAYRSTDVDIESCSEGGYNVGWISTGEMLEYTVNVASAGSYNVNVRVASPNTGGSFHIEMNGANVTGSKTVPNTGGWQTWTTVTSTVTLNAGQQTLRLCVDNGGWNVNYISVTSAGGSQTPYAGVIALPGTIQAENYDNGGEGVAYHDIASGNAGGQYRTDGVDIENTSDTGGGYNVGYIDSGEWLEYTVNVTATGDYDFYVRVASPNNGSSFKILLDGVDKTGARGFESTGGWQNWTTIIIPARNLSSGQHVLQFNVVSGGFNLNKIDVYSRGSDAVSIDMGAPDILDGITHIQVADGDTVPWTSAGHTCRENWDFPDIYMYFSVSSAWAWQGSKPDVYITFDYYDLGTGQLGLDYDATSSPYKHINGPTLTNTGGWKQYTFHVTDAYFGNRQNGGSDMRFTAGAYEWGIDTVCVYQ